MDDPWQPQTQHPGVVTLHADPAGGPWPLHQPQPAALAELGIRRTVLDAGLVQAVGQTDPGPSYESQVSMTRERRFAVTASVVDAAK